MKRLQQRRQAAGLSQSQLVEKVDGLSVRTLQHYEQGSMNINKAAAETVVRIAQALDCRVEDILELEKPEQFIF